MPMARSAVVVGRSLADMLNSLLGLAVLLGVGIAVGWEWHGTTPEALAAIGLLLLLRFAFLWLGILLARPPKAPRPVQGLWPPLFPLPSLSGAFFPPPLLPAGSPLSPGNADHHGRRHAPPPLQPPGAPGGVAWVAGPAQRKPLVGPQALLSLLLPLSMRR